MHGVAIVVQAAVGAFFRRFWGGWENKIEWHFLKIGIALALGLLDGIFVLHSASAALMFGFFFAAVMLNPFHSKGQRMGNGGAPSLLGSIAWMSGSYFIGTAVMGFVTFLSEGSIVPLAYIPTGLFASVGYLLGWYVFPSTFGGLGGVGYNKPFWRTGTTAEGNPIYFIDSPTAIGELFLGAVLLGGLPLAAWIAG